jgi:hypothetical protein
LKEVSEEKAKRRECVEKERLRGKSKWRFRAVGSHAKFDRVT